MASKISDYIKQLRDIASGEQYSDVSKSKALKVLLRWDTEWAQEHLKEFVESDRIWAIEIAMRLEQKKQGEVTGLGILEGDDE
jgi:glycerate-2-kinase